MDKSKSNGSQYVSTRGGSSKGAQTKEANRGEMQSSQLMKLFEEELKDIYWAEKALTKAIPKTEEQVKRVEQVFELTGKKAVAKKCEAMEGLIKEAEEIMEECEEGAMRDAGIISAGQKVEHYEMASYGTLRQFAETLGLTDAVALLEETLNEEKIADKKLTEVALSAVNVEASEEEETRTKKSSK